MEKGEKRAPKIRLTYLHSILSALSHETFWGFNKLPNRDMMRTYQYIVERDKRITLWMNALPP